MIIRNLITAGALVLAASTLAQAAPGSDPQHDTCLYEDGSGQRVCVWDARHQGNGEGRSFISIWGGTDRAKYVTLTHAKAHRLTH